MECTDDEICLESFLNGNDQRFKELCDAKLRTDDGYVFAVHRCILATKSKFFYVLLCDVDMHKTGIQISGIRGSILLKILSYLYTNTIHFTEDIADILITSDYLLLDDLVLKCEEYARYSITSRNCLQMFAAAYHLNKKEIYYHSYRILRMYFKDIVSNVNSKIEDLPLKLLNELLSCENLNGKIGDVWEVIVRWVESDKFQRLPFVAELIHHLNVTALDENLATTIIEHDIVEQSPFFKDVIELKASGLFNSNLEIFCGFRKSKYNSFLEINNCQRLPSKLYIFVETPNLFADNDVYITFDENLNICRRLIQCNFFPIFVASLREWIYMVHISSSHFFTLLNFKRFNLIEKQWIEIPIPRAATYIREIVEHQGLIYFFGCRPHWKSRQGFKVFAYNLNSDTWTEFDQITPFTLCCTVSQDSKIYLIGSIAHDAKENVLLFQEFDPFSNTWNTLPFQYHNISMWWLEPYCNKLYFVAEQFSTSTHQTNNSVPAVASVYDPIMRYWTALPDPPIKYEIANLMNLHDQLFILDCKSDELNIFPNFNPCCLLRWNDYVHQWDTCKELSLLPHIHQYIICPIKDEVTIKIIAEENRKMLSEFEECPFA